MAREIKFRWWNGQRMIPQENMDILLRNVSNLGLDNVMQFTGLQDRNGKDIYEGDIVTYDQPEYRQVVEFGSHDKYTAGHGYNEESIISGWKIGGYYGSPDRAVIIGNIHENPELLES